MTKDEIKAKAKAFAQAWWDDIGEHPELHLASGLLFALLVQIVLVLT